MLPGFLAVNSGAQPSLDQARPPRPTGRAFGSAATTTAYFKCQAQEHRWHRRDRSSCRCRVSRPRRRRRRNGCHRNRSPEQQHLLYAQPVAGVHRPPRQEFCLFLHRRDVRRAERWLCRRGFPDASDQCIRHLEADVRVDAARCSGGDTAASARMCRCSAAITRRQMARAYETTSMSRSWHRRTCAPSTICGPRTHR